MYGAPTYIYVYMLCDMSAYTDSDGQIDLAN